MPGITIGRQRPPETSPAYTELTRAIGSGVRRKSRWTGRGCELVPDGEMYFQLDGNDRARYLQAGCTSMGAQPARHGVTAGGGVSTNFVEAWCCQPPQVLEVFEQYVASSEYRNRRYMGLAFAGAMLFGAYYLVKNRERFGWKLGESKRTFSFGANPEDVFDELEFDDEEWRDDV